MSRRATRLAVAVASFGAAAAISALPATAAATAAAKPTQVGIVVRVSGSSTMTACVAQGGDGVDVLVRGFPNTEIPTSGPYAGFVVSIDDVGQNPPDDTHYWSYWHASANGWKYSSTGGASYTPQAGAVEGWSYVNGTDDPPMPPVYSYQRLCGGKDSGPAPSKTHPAPRPTHSNTPDPAPHRHHGSSSSHARTHPPTPERSTASPTSSAPTSTPTGPASHPHPATDRAAVSAHTRHRSRSATGSSAPPARPSPAPTSGAAPAAARSPSLPPAAGGRSTGGFPAFGTALAIAVVAVLGGVAWLRLRRRPE